MQDAIEAAMIMEGGLAASKLVGKGAKAAGKYLTEETALKNAYKLNPLAFKANPEAYYRMLGKEGYEDILESGAIRANPGKGGLKSQEFNDVYFSMKHPWDGRNYGYVTKSGEPIGGIGYKGPYMAELTGQELNHPISSFPTTNMAQSKVPISIENSGIKLYKQDWLKGYKEVPKPTSTQQVTRGPINWWDDPKYKKENPNFNPETYLNNPIGNPNASRDIPKGMEPRLSKDKNGGWLNKYK
jgi:hypothetical protein